ncbi:MAG TPA: response regulator [Ignavibacteria bacterium]|nr:response regulator [Ignavibacteria bacterium]
MKIRSRILLINFITVFVVISAITIAFYSIMYNVLADKQSQLLLKSANNFVYAYQENLDKELTEVSNYINLKNKNVKPRRLDFILQKENKSSDVYSYVFIINKLKHFKTTTTITDFVSNNPFIDLHKYISPDGKEYIYGRRITQDHLTDISRQIGSEIALIWKDFPSIVSSRIKTRNHLFALKKITKELELKNNFDIITSSIGSSNLVATKYKPQSFSYKKDNLQFIIFTSIEGLTKLQSNLLLIILIISFTGIVLSLILTMIFSNRIRNQLDGLNKAALFIGKGTLNKKIEVKSNDEVGELANAFNNMIDDLNKSEKAKKEYSNFIELINQNPTLKEFSDATLSKIIKTGNFAIGALYNVEGDDVQLCSSYGIDEDELPSKNVKYLRSVIATKEIKDLSLNEETLTISLGIVSLKIKRLLIIPIIYNNKVIGILELGSEGTISEELWHYLTSIKKQLAIGLTNANAFLQLEQMVEELRKLNEEFQKQNVQIKEQNKSLKELHNQLKEKAEELEIQKDKAEEATRLKSQFLASMSHELRTPMNAILGLTELILEESTLIDKDKERLQVVLKSGKRLMVLINDVLDLSKIEAGKMDINYDTLILNDLINEVEVNIKPLIKDKNLLFKINKKTNTNIIINTDGYKITQVLINLIGNAIKFTNEGFVELAINLLPNNILEFKVTDTGIGISDEDKKIIFEEFRQADGSTTRKHSGTGLGLAISSKIVKLLKGNLQVVSELSKGSTFTFTLPVEVIEIVKDDKETDKQEIKKQETKKNVVLVIDDDSDTRYTVGSFLETKNYDVIFAEDGKQGLEKAIEQQPFAIILDVMMPDKDGWQILEELKDNDKTKDIPVVIFSILEDKQLAFSLGAFDYMVKPISGKKLNSVFKKLEVTANKKIETIAIVDDDEIEFERFKKEFKNDNIRINYIKDSRIAFSQIKESQPDLIVLDLIMPNVDGITLAEKLKSDKLTKEIPIIISTAKDLTEEENEQLEKIVEQVALKSNEHPLDALLKVRERLQLQEMEITRVKSSDDKQAIKIKKSTVENNPLIMIVDDDADTLFTINELIESCNYQTVLAKDGLECMKKLKEITPDLILLDIMMPRMDGFQVLQKIRANKKWEKIPVFAVTARAMEEDKKIILKHGFNDYIPKPVDPLILTNKITTLLNKLTKIKNA